MDSTQNYLTLIAIKLNSLKILSHSFFSFQFIKKKKNVHLNRLYSNSIKLKA